MAWHQPVLVSAVLSELAVSSDSVVVDATAGDGGHIEALCSHNPSPGRIIGLDADPHQIERAGMRLQSAGLQSAGEHCPVELIHSNFRRCDAALRAAGVDAVDRFLFDLGWCSFQIDESGRGFSFRTDEKLDMTFGGAGESDVTAYDVVNTWEEDVLKDIIRGYGEERYAQQIASEIATRRRQESIETTVQLSDIIIQATPARYHRERLHPATRTFQAIRMAVNDEVQALEQGLQAAWSMLRDEGRISVISFHSIEDRIVKNMFRNLEHDGAGSRLHTKPTVAGDEEREANPRSRSAKLRTCIKAA